MIFNTSPDLSKSEISELQNRSWHIDCVSMNVKSRSPKPLKFYGPGMIYQTNDGNLRFKLYVTRRDIKQYKFKPRLRAGQLIPEDAYFDLSAKDHTGRTWKAERILISQSSSFIIGVTIIDEGLSEVSCIGRIGNNISNKDNLSVWVFENFDIPCNETTVEKKSIAHKRAAYSWTLNAWKFKTLGIEFLLTNGDKKIPAIRCTLQSGEFPFLLEERVLEGFQFILGHPIPWIVIRKQTGNKLSVKISSRQQRFSKLRLMPPLPTKQIVEPSKKKLTTKYHKKLFESYLRYSLKSDRKRHPLWGYINAVYEAGGSSFIDSEALALVVAIEGLIQVEFSKLVKLSKKDKKQISAIQEYIDNWNGKENIKRRAKGAISQFKKIRVVDIMLKLEEVSAITQEQRKDWESLRHPAAHAFQTGNLSADKMRLLLPKVKVLFYHLIFYAIGYRGPYMDITTIDWPIKEYNPKLLNDFRSQVDDG